MYILPFPRNGVSTEHHVNIENIMELQPTTSEQSTRHMHQDKEKEIFTSCVERQTNTEPESEHEDNENRLVDRTFFITFIDLFSEIKLFHYAELKVVYYYNYFFYFITVLSSSMKKIIQQISN